MAERRMFAKTIIDSDAFLDMPQSTQNLYFHLGMRADDEGFINNSKKIQKMIGASEDDLKLLIAKSFIIPFETGIVVIKHWKIHNYIQKDRFHETKYIEEKGELELKENGVYTKWIQDVSKMDTEVRLGKVRLGKASLGEDIGSNKITLGEFQNVKLNQHEMDKLIKRFPSDYMTRIERLSEYMASKGKRYKNHYATILAWDRKDKQGRITNTNDYIKSEKSFTEILGGE